jgi:hypothetical protein
MLVVDQKHHILGSLNKNFGRIRPGEKIVIEHGRQNAFDDLVNPSQVYFLRITAPVVEVQRSVSIDEMDAMNLHRQLKRKPGKDDFAVIAAHDRQFRQLLEAGGQFEVYDDLVNTRVIAKVRLNAIMADLDTSERLFDLDEFTPH